MTPDSALGDLNRAFGLLGRATGDLISLIWGLTFIWGRMLICHKERPDPIPLTPFPPKKDLTPLPQDGTNGVADLSSILTAHDCGIYEELKDIALFAQARLEMGVVTWPNGADLDPAWMHDELRKSKTWSVPI